MEPDVEADQNFYARTTGSPIIASAGTGTPSLPSPLSLPHRPLIPPTDIEIPSQSVPAARAAYHDPNNTLANMQHPGVAPRTNQMAAGANGSLALILDGAGDPEDYYKEYKGAQAPALVDRDVTRSPNNTSAAAGDRRVAATKSNGILPAAAKPIDFAAGRAGLRPAFRSASAPMNTGIPKPSASAALSGGAGAGGAPKVKDLLKKFDANNSEVSAIPRPFARSALPKRDVVGGANGGLKSRTGYMAPTALGRIVPGQHEDSRVVSNPGPRKPGASDDVHASSTGPTRLVRARRSPQIAEEAGRASTQSPPRSPRSPRSPKRIMNKADASLHTPLFGEVLDPLSPGAQAGHGIARANPPPALDIAGNTSSTNRPDPTGDKTATEISPTAWYLGISGAADASELSAQRTNRAQTELDDVSANLLKGVNASVLQARDAQYHAGQHELARSPDSKLPLLSHRSDQDAAMAHDVRPKAATHARKPTANKLQKPNPNPRARSPVPRAPTPTSRAKPPSRPSSRLAARRNEENRSGTSVPAYVSPTLPSPTSPRLRSSKPRAPVYSASTESSRRKLAERAESPAKSRTGMRITRRSPTESRRPDQSIKADELEMASAIARIKEEMNRTYAQQAQTGKRVTDPSPRQYDFADSSGSPTGESSPIGSTLDLLHNASPPLHLSTTSPAPPPLPYLVQPFDTHYTDSPTLGASSKFTADDSYAASIRSGATGVTDIENEEQTEEARRRDALPSGKQQSPHAGRAIAGSSSDHQADAASQEAKIKSHEVFLAPARMDRSMEPTPTRDEFGLPRPRFHSIEYHASQGCPTPGFPRAHADSIPRESELREDDPLAISDLPFSYRPFDLEPLTFQPDEEHGATPASEADQDDNKDSAVSEEHEAGRPAHPRRMNSRNSYDPFRESSPRLGQEPSWTAMTGNSDPNEASLRVSNIFRESNPPQMQPLLSPMSPESPMVPFPGSEYPSYPSPSEHFSPRFANGFPLVPPLPGSQTPAELGLGIHTMPTADAVDPPSPLWQGQDEQEAGSRGSAFNSSSVSDNSHASSRQQSSSLSRPPTHSPRVSLDARPHSQVHRISKCSSDKDSLQAPSAPHASHSPVSAEVVRGAASRRSTSLTLEQMEAVEAENHRITQRAKTIDELMSTEAVYLKDLTIIQSLYQGTAASCPALNPQDIRDIFINLDDVVGFTNYFCGKMKETTSRALKLNKQQSRSSKSSMASVMTSTTDNAPASSMSPEQRMSRALTLLEENELRNMADRRMQIAKIFLDNLPELRTVYGTWIRSSNIANARLAELQKEPDVQVWLKNCDEGIKGLTGAWDLNALLVKPLQRATKYTLLLDQILKYTPADHPEYDELQLVRAELVNFCADTNSKIVDPKPKTPNRKRKESEVRTTIKTLLYRNKKPTPTKAAEDEDEKFTQLAQESGNDYLSLQLVLRDIELVTRQTTDWVQTFLRYLSAIEVVVRPSKIPGDTSNSSPYPEIESKWIGINKAMADMGTVALADYQRHVREQVIEPLEAVIKLYGNPEQLMIKRRKKQQSLEKALALRAQGKKVDSRTAEALDQYTALSDSLKTELPKLKELTQRLALTCYGNLVLIQVRWFELWSTKIFNVLQANQIPHEWANLLQQLQMDQPYYIKQVEALAVLSSRNTASSEAKPRMSQSTTNGGDSGSVHGRPSLVSSRSRNASIRSEKSPAVYTPDSGRDSSGTYFPHDGGLEQMPSSPAPPLPPVNPELLGLAATPYSRIRLARPDSSRQSSDQDALMRQNANFQSNFNVLANMQLASNRSSVSESEGRRPVAGFNVLYLAASLFEFDVETVNTESGYPYLNYGAGEVFDVIGEKGELWLAKNQDDDNNNIGWIWSKHFARVAMQPF